MAAEIYSGIDGIECPDITFDDYSNGTWKEKEENYLSQLKEVCKFNSKGSAIGEVIRFPVADSYAQYMVYSLKPLELIHIATGDAWHSEFAELLTVKKTLELVQREKNIRKLFANKS